jgi:molecular chaperone GrpE
MLQRTAFRAARQAARPISRFQKPAFTPARPQQLSAAVRYYADQPAAANGNGNGASATQNGNGEAPAAGNAEQLKQQLEQKDKEIVDLKVRIFIIPSSPVIIPILTPPS